MKNSLYVFQFMIFFNFEKLHTIITISDEISRSVDSVLSLILKLVLDCDVRLDVRCCVMIFCFDCDVVIFCFDVFDDESFDIKLMFLSAFYILQCYLLSTLTIKY